MVFRDREDKSQYRLTRWRSDGVWDCRVKLIGSLKCLFYEQKVNKHLSVSIAVTVQALLNLKFT